MAIGNPKVMIGLPALIASIVGSALIAGVGTILATDKTVAVLDMRLGALERDSKDTSKDVGDLKVQTSSRLATIEQSTKNIHEALQRIEEQLKRR